MLQIKIVCKKNFILSNNKKNIKNYIYNGLINFIISFHYGKY